MKYVAARKNRSEMPMVRAEDFRATNGLRSVHGVYPMENAKAVNDALGHVVDPSASRKRTTPTMNSAR